MLDHAAISGSPGDGIYSQTIIIGNFFLVLSLEGPPKEVSLELGRNSLAKIEEIISQTPAITPKELVEMETEAFSNGIKINFLVAKIENPFGLAQGGQKLSLSGVGDVAARIIRKEKMIKLFPVSRSGDNSPESTPSLSGVLLHQDFLILATTAFYSNISLSDLASGFSGPVEEIRDLISPKIETVTENSRVAVLLVKVELQEEELVDDKTLTPNPITNLQPPIAPHPNPKSSSLSPFSKLLSHILAPLSHSPRSLYLHRPRDPNAPAPASRKVLYLSLIILITLISLIVFQLRSKVLEERSKAVQAVDRQVKDSLDSAQKLSGLNDQLARDVLIQTRQDVTAKAVQAFGPDWQKDDSFEGKRLRQILAGLDTEITKVSKIYSLAKLDLFYDFSLLKSKAVVSSAWAHKGEAVALDAGNGAVYSLNLSTKGAAIVSGGDSFRQGKYLDFTANSVYVWTMDGVFAIDRSVSPATTKVLFKPSDKWGDIKDLKVFAGNIYLLDVGKSQVWKYQSTDFGFAGISNYLNSGLPVDFANVKGMAIDGSVYVLTATGNIAQFSAGSSLNFQITGLDPALKNPTAFFANDDVNNLYVLDSNGKRVVVLSKRGSYVAQYLLPISNIQFPISNVVADESLHKVFLFAGHKVYTFDLH